MHRPTRWGAVVIALSACTSPAMEQALYAKQAMVGMSKADLLSCAGVPDRRMSVGNQDFFTYVSRQIISYPSWGGYWGWPMYAADIAVFDCEATFTFRDGVVDRIVYGGRSGGANQLSQCYAIVQNCLGTGPQRPRSATGAEHHVSINPR